MSSTTPDPKVKCDTLFYSWYTIIIVTGTAVNSHIMCVSCISQMIAQSILWVL